MHSEVKEILAFTRLFNLYKRQVYNYAVRMVSDRMAAEDIVQNVFLKLYENINSIRNRESINYWIFRTARNEIYAWYRRQKSYRKVFNSAEADELIIDSGIDVAGEIEIKELSAIIAKEVEALPEVYKEIFILKEYAGLSYREIAGVMSVTEDLVKSRLFKIRKKLIEKLTTRIL